MKIREELIPYLDDAFKRGLRVVPLRLDGGAPQVRGVGSLPAVIASSKQELEEKWGDREVEAYGVMCGEGILVIDADLDRENLSDAKDNFEELKKRLPETYTVKTPGGKHLYFSVPKDMELKNNSGSWFGEGIEVKGTNGRVTGAGSVTYRRKGDGTILRRDYEVLDDRPIAEAPTWLIEKAKRDPREPRASIVPQGEPLPDLAEKYINRLEGVDIHQRNTALYNLARKLSVTYRIPRHEAPAFMRMYNEKNNPPMEDAELESVTDSGYRYNQYTLEDDVFHPEITQQPQQPTPQNDTPAPDIVRKKGSDKVLYKISELEELPDPDYVVEKWVIRKGVNFLVADAGVGKSMLILDWVLRVEREGLRILNFVGEHLSGYEARLKAWRKHYYLDRLPDNFYYLGNREFPTTLTVTDQLKRVTDEGAKFDIVVLDTFERFAENADANDGKEMAMVMKQLEEFAEDTGSAVLCAHHTAREAQRIRGSSTLDARASTIAILKKQEDYGFSVKQTKNKDDEDGVKEKYERVKTFRGKVVLNLYGQFEGYREKPQEELDYDEVKQRVLDIVTASQDTTRTLNTEKDIVKPILEEMPHHTRDSIKRIMDKLVGDAKIGNDRLKPYIVTYADNKGYHFIQKRQDFQEKSEKIS